KPAAPLLRLLIPGLAMPAGVSAQAQSRFPAYARRTTPALSPTRAEPARCGSRPWRDGLVICGRRASGRLGGVRRRRHPAGSCRSPLALGGDDVAEQPVGLM